MENKANRDQEENEGSEVQATGGKEEEDKKATGSSGMDQGLLKQFLAMSLGIQDKPPSKLEEMTLAGIAKYLASSQCRNIITMAGAGISTSAGIPDFRSPGTGLYDNLASYDLPNPQAIFDIQYFKENPRPFFVLAKALYPGSFKPTLCHYFIKLLSDKGKLLRHFTQNIDTLERVAGLGGDEVVEAHGTFHSNHCLECQAEYDQDWMKGKVFSDKIPRCEEEGCEGLVKPDIVFFGESLPPKFGECVAKDFPKCDLLIVMGTSLMVQPFASLVSRVPMETPRLYINLEKGPTTTNPITAMMFGGGFEFDAEDNYRDVFHEATCDAGCQELADLMGWGEELKTMVSTEHAKISEAGQKQPVTRAVMSPGKPKVMSPGKPKVMSPGKPEEELKVKVALEHTEVTEVTATKQKQSDTSPSKPKDKTPSASSEPPTGKTPSPTKAKKSPSSSLKKSPSPLTKAKKTSPPGGKGKI